LLFCIDFISWITKNFYATDHAADSSDAEEHSKKKARPSSPALEIGTAECDAMLACGGAHVPDHGTTASLKLPRAALVARVISLVEAANREVYIRGAAGAGKSVLLALVGQELARQNKRFVLVPDARDLRGKWYEIVDMAKLSPIYLLVDEVHTATNSSVWKYLKKPLHMRPLVHTIAAGIPDESQASAMFREHTEVEEILLGLDELETWDVVNFFAARLKQALQQQQQQQQRQRPEQNAPPGDDILEAHREAALRALRFAHSYTQGHAYPCLKMAEFLLTEASVQCMSTGVPAALLAVTASAAFATSVFKAIYNRCYSKVSSETAAQLLVALEKPVDADKVYVELTRLGLWLPIRGMSLLLQYTVMHRYRQAARVAT
jgi:hypothetical protein